jgi:hypothetical protein
MPRITKAEKQRLEMKQRENKMFREDPPWSESNKNTDYYHCHEMKALRDIRFQLESLIEVLEKQRAHYTLSAVIIPESLPEQLRGISDEIYEEQMTRDAGGKPTERSFIALQGQKKEEPPAVDDSDTDDDVSECDFCGEADTDDHECREHVPCCSR